MTTPNINQPGPERVKNLILALNAQHPNPWTRGAAYPAKNPVNNADVLIRRTTQNGIHFLHIYVKVDRVIRTPEGVELFREPSQAHYRANLKTFELIEIN